MKHVGLILIALLALAAGGLTRYLFIRPQHVDIILPAFSLPDTNSVIRASAEWQGTVRLINFWATWCPSCLKEIPSFMVLQSKYGNEKVQFIGIALDDVAAVKVFQEKTGVNYPLLIAGDWAGFALAKKMGNIMSAIPYTVVVNSAGMIIYRHMGELSASELNSVVEPLL